MLWRDHCATIGHPYARLLDTHETHPGDKRRYLSEDAIDTVTREHGAFGLSETSKLFDNADFGYRRITVQRPLRLKFQITQEAKAQFLDACPELLDAVLEMEATFAPDRHYDWTEIWAEVQRIVKESDSDWLKGAKGTA